jgi:putative transposase
MFHVMSRGTGKQNISICDADRRHFVSVLDTVVHRYEWVCHSYCLLKNHYHLILETPESNLASGMHYLNSVFSIMFNKRHQKIGHVLQGRYNSRIIDNNRYFLTAVRYIALNPVKDGFCDCPLDWKWGSYRSFLGAEEPSSLLNTTFTLSIFDQLIENARVQLKEFVEITTDQQLPIPFEELAAFEAELESDRSFALAKRVPLSVMFTNGIPRSQRDAAVLKAYSSGSYTLLEIADYLGLSKSSISKIVSRGKSSAK